RHIGRAPAPDRRHALGVPGRPRDHRPHRRGRDMGEPGAASVSPVTDLSRITARSWGPAPSSWSDDPRWYAERMTLDGERWFARVRPGDDPSLPPVVMVHGVIISGTYYRT